MSESSRGPDKRPKPKHLTRERALRFSNPSVAERYHLRLPYPEETFEILSGLIVDRPRMVLDVGTGTGEIARRLAGVADRVDAVDISEAMIERGKRLTGGDRVNWILGPLETVELHGPYALITGGDSLHWMDWHVVFPRFARLLSPNGVVAIVTRWEEETPWQETLWALIQQYSTVKDYEAYDLVHELEQRGLFRQSGERVTQPIQSYQSIDDYIHSFHSRSSLSLAAMPVEDAGAFDEALREAVFPYAANGYLTLETRARIRWGRPTP